MSFTLRLGSIVALQRSEFPTKLELRAEVYLQNDTEFKPIWKLLSLNITADANVTVTSNPITEQLPLMTASVNKYLEAKFQVRDSYLFCRAKSCTTVVIEMIVGQVDLGGQSPVRVKLFVGLPTSLQTSARAAELFEIGKPQVSRSL